MYNKLFSLVSTISLTLGVLTLGACGGGNNPTNSTNPSTNQGQFKDANVDGLSYTGSFPSVTENGGRFNYQSGDMLAFSIGGISLGTATAKSIITPIDLVAGSGINTPAVQNIVSLLTLLDSDGNTANAVISLDPDVAIALAGTAATFNVTTATFTTKLGTILTTAKTVGTYTTTVAAIQAAAVDHLTDTLSCAYSGVYTGSITGGSATENFVFLIDSNNLPFGFANDGSSIILNGNNIDFAQNPPTFSATSISTSFSYAATLTDVDNFEVVKSDASSSQTFTISRLGVDTNVKYRFVASTIQGLMTVINFAAAAEGTTTHNVDVFSYYISGGSDSILADNNAGAVTLSDAGTATFTINATQGSKIVTITATIDIGTGTVSGNIQSTDTQDANTFIGSSSSICTLN